MTSATPYDSALQEVLIETRFLSYAPAFAQWEAVGPNYDLGSPIGFGHTREEAIEDLIYWQWEDFSFEGFCAMMGEEG